MSNISFLGAASGLPLEELVSTFVKTERDVKLGRINSAKTVLDASLSGIGRLKSALSAFQDSLKKLDTSALSTRTAQVTQPDNLSSYIDAKASNNASASSFNVSVVQLAQGSRLESADGEFNSGSDVIATNDAVMTFTVGSQSFDVDVTAGMTLNELRAAINSNSGNFGITANIVNAGGVIGSKLVLSSSVTGDGNDLIVTNNSAELDRLSSNLSSRQNAQDAIINIDGIVARSRSNVFENVVEDVSITAKTITPPGKSATVDVSTDKKAVKENIKKFVESFNALVDQINSLTKPRTLGDDGKSVTAEAGALNGDALPRTILTQLRSIFGASNADSDPEFSTLFSLGISMNKDGKLEIGTSTQFGESGEAKFERVLEENFDAISKFFGGDNGLSKKLDNFVSDFNKSGGIIAGRENAIREQIKNNSKALDAATRYIDQYEDTMRKKYQALDSLLAQLQSTSSYVTAQLASLPGFNVKKS